MMKHVLCARLGSKRFVLFILPNNPLREVRMVSPFFRGGSGRLYDSLKVTRPVSPGARSRPSSPTSPPPLQTRLYSRGSEAKAASFWARAALHEAGLSAELGWRVWGGGGVGAGRAGLGGEFSGVWAAVSPSCSLS